MKKQQTEVSEKYTDFVTTAEVRKFYEIWKKLPHTTGEEIFVHFGAVNAKTGDVYQMEFDVVDRWYSRHIVGTGLENELLRAWVQESGMPFTWVSFMLDKIGFLAWRDKEEQKERDRQAEEFATEGV